MKEINYPLQFQLKKWGNINSSEILMNSKQPIEETPLHIWTSAKYKKNLKPTRVKLLNFP